MSVPVSEIIQSINSEIFDLGGVLVYSIEPGIIVSQYYEDVELDIDLATEINRVVGELGGGLAYPQLFIACPGQTVTKEVREWSAEEFSNQYTVCTAIVCNSLAHKIIGNFFCEDPKTTTTYQNVW